MLRRKDPIVAVDIGTSKIRVLVGEVGDNGEMMITGIGEAVSSGVRKGEIVNADHVRHCLEEAVHLAENNTGTIIQSAYLLISGGHVESLVNRGTMPVMDETGEITEADLEQVKKMARAVNLPMDRVFLHTICQSYTVDDQDGIMDPVGMQGSRLEADFLIIMASYSRIQNRMKVVTDVDVDVIDAPFSGLCSALAVLTPEQKEQGALVIDLGGGKTDYVAYAGRAIAQAGCLAVGGEHITNDIAQGLGLPHAQAEKLKVTEGQAYDFQDDTRSRIVRLPAEGGFSGCDVNLRALNRIIQERVQETFALIRERLAGSGVLAGLGAGVILTGGAAGLAGIMEAAEKVFGLPCNIGLPTGLAGAAAIMDSPEYAAAAGLLKFEIKNAQQQARAGGNWRKLLGFMQGKES